MIAKIIRITSHTLLTAGLMVIGQAPAAEQTSEDAIAVARSAIKADRHETVTQTLQLTEAEAEEFWPLYHQYRAEMDQVGDGIVELLREYGASYPNVPEDRARKMLKKLTRLEKKRVATRSNYLKEFGEVLPASKNLRFAQVENRLDLALLLELAASVPLVPIEGQITGGTSAATSYTGDVPGGVIGRTVEWTAKVAALDTVGRKITLVSPDGIKKTVKAGPEVINFDQISVGDQMTITATEELVVHLADPGEAAEDQAVTRVELAPKGARPGGRLAETTQVTGKVTAIDEKQRTATLQFQDGSLKTLPVRDDVDLSKRKVGEQVVFKVTEMIAVRVSKN